MKMNLDKNAAIQMRQLILSAVAGAATEAILRGIVKVKSSKTDYLEKQRSEVSKAISFYNKGDVKKAVAEIEKSIRSGIKHENKLFSSENLTRLRVYWDEVVPDVYGQIEGMAQLEDRVKYYLMYIRSV